MKECSQCSEEAVGNTTKCLKHTISGRVTSQRAREKKKKLGLCYECSDKAVGGSRCPKHAALRNQDYYHRSTSGFCIGCEAPAIPNERQCPSCKETSRLLQKARGTKAKELGNCPNHVGEPAVPGRTTCVRCGWLTFESAIKKYDGLTLETYAWMEHDQDRACASCGDRVELVVDHDHATGKVRALLCSSCNRLIGHAKEEIARLTAAIWYLQKFTSGQR